MNPNSYVSSIQKFCRKQIKLTLPSEEEKETQGLDEPGLDNSFDDEKAQDNGSQSPEDDNQNPDSIDIETSSDWKLNTNYSNCFIEENQKLQIDPRINLELPEDFDELTIFERFFPKTLRETIAEETNRYYSQLQVNQKNYLSQFKPVDEQSILKFTGTLLAMGLFPRKTLDGR